MKDGSKRRSCLQLQRALAKVVLDRLGQRRPRRGSGAPGIPALDLSLTLQAERSAARERFRRAKQRAQPARALCVGEQVVAAADELQQRSSAQKNTNMTSLLFRGATPAIKKM
jgi:hypothetical protein